jgi:hypothetical protein
MFLNEEKTASTICWKCKDHAFVLSNGLCVDCDIFEYRRKSDERMKEKSKKLEA